MSKNTPATSEETVAPVAEVQAEGTPATPVEKKLSPKNKKVRGIDPSLITTYVELNQSKDRNQLVQNAAKAKGLKVSEYLNPILANAVSAAWPQIEADAATYTPTVKGPTLAGKKLEDLSPDELQKVVDRNTKAMANAQKATSLAADLLAKARANKAAAQG